MKYYVTVLRTQKITYAIEAEGKREAVEQAMYNAEMDEVPFDVSDPSNEMSSCITNSEYLHYLRKDKNN